MTFLLAFIAGAISLCGAPVFVILGGAALWCFYSAGIDISAVIIELYRMTSAPTLVAIPFFTFAGYLLAESKAPLRFVELYQSLFGWMPGGIVIVTITACAFFTAFTGASGVTIVALGGLVLPILIKDGYSEKFSLGLVTCCGSVGLLFPPSLPIILYGVVAGVSIDELFLAGIVPGIVLVATLSAFGIVVSLRGRKATEAIPRDQLGSGDRFAGAPAKLPAGKRSDRNRLEYKRIFAAVKDAAWELPIPLIILIGIYGGFFTTGEAAVVTVVYVWLVEVFVKRDLHIIRDVPRIMRESMVLVGGILIILGVALGFTNYLVDAQVPTKLFEFVRQYISSKYTFLIILNVFLLVVGCLMDVFSATIVVVPLIAPIAKEFGINPLHLGIIFLTNLEIGYMTPPVGLNLFISSFRFKKPITFLYRASFQFLMAMIVALLVITYVPDLSLWLAGFLNK
ncbi:MAG: C4-dicarboxylate ABC transporter [Deltaproteobacteria bacterium CG11_big_fil_rev_8_21_14_0_20_49_13]|nr:MAG: C4-dicarboxylate ABC transporter [Deltaproteobacteria bacterium CG11_big_fil_rev_8_21_14_0_20_49_13]